ncbi:galectin-7-like [Mesoplodon densirostris]|uniref:galectin-7-like n=1 Tax=Mesoplodon densirostris TaxID=48708 RepID=UPI0028DC5073|nr:galectin-7-like [Mesoplodon densirostris]
MAPGASGGGTKNGRQAFRAAGTEVGLVGPHCLGAGARVPTRPSVHRRPAEPRNSVLGRGGRRCAQVRETAPNERPKCSCPASLSEALPGSSNCPSCVVRGPEGGWDARKAVDQKLPYRVPLPDGFKVGTVMKVRGVVPEDAESFHINLMCSDKDDSDIVLHFNPRPGKSTVVINTLKCGNWGPEERGSDPAFLRGETFDLLLIAKREGFKFVLGDKEYYEFRYRLPPERAVLVEVDGDVQLEFATIF